MIVTVVDALIRYLYGSLGYGHGVRAFLKLVGTFVLWTLLGIGLCFVSLLPNLMLALSASRGIANPIELLYGPDYYINLVGALCGSAQAGIYGYINMPLAAFALVILSLVNHNDRGKAYRFVLLVCAAIFLFPFLARIFNGFAGQTNRWCFAFSFAISCICALEMPRLAQATSEGLKLASAVVVAYCLAVLFLSVLGYDVHGDAHPFRSPRGSPSPLPDRFKKRKIDGRSPLPDHRRRNLLFALSLLTRGSPAGSFPEFTDAGKAYSDSLDVTARAVRTDFVERVDGINPAYANYYMSSNYGLRSGNAGL